MTSALLTWPVPPLQYQEPLHIGPLRLASRFTLAPLAGYTNYPFRRSVRAIASIEGEGAPDCPVGLCTTDLVNARAIMEKTKKTKELLATGPDDRPLSVQIFGGNPDEMAGAAKWLEDYGATTIDINMGCPVRKVVRVGGGSAMMCDTTGTTIKLVERVVNAVKLPVSVKMRLGWDDTQLTAPYFAREFEKIGVQALTIHGRTREQGFTGAVSRAGIRAVVEAVENIPIFGNGDVITIQDAATMIAETGCDGIAIGRGSLINPWIFRQLESWIRTGDPGPRASYHERIDFMSSHLRKLCEWKGNEFAGCTSFRKVAAWYAKALRTGKEVKHKLTLINSLAEFEGIANQLRDNGPPSGWGEWDAVAAKVEVPSGPIAHW
jgi:tRNA-dihydrouridine synthase B